MTVLLRLLKKEAYAMRMNIELPESQVDDLKVLMGKIGVETYKDLFNNALTLLEWTVAEVAAGRSIAAVDEISNRYRELAMPIFENARKAALREKANQRPETAEAGYNNKAGAVYNNN